jgi:hypothetical protein
MNYSALLSYDKKYRWKLERIWQPAKAPVVWVMLNPSTADASRDDATIRRCIGFSMNWGFGGIEVYNLFAFRATNPAALLEAKDPVGEKNDEYLKAIPIEREIICAWGALPKGFGQQRLVLREKNVLMMLTGRKMRCLGYTQNGYPRHPVRLPYSTSLEEVLVPEPVRP